jgi:hypothetical protein
LLQQQGDERASRERKGLKTEPNREPTREPNGETICETLTRGAFK